MRTSPATAGLPGATPCLRDSPPQNLRKTFPLPAHDRIRLNENQGVPPTAPDLGQTDPEQPIPLRQSAPRPSRSVLLGSRAASAAMIAGFILLVLFGFARVVFGVHIEGSFVGFLGVCTAFSVMTAAFGLMIAALGETLEATRGYSIMATLIMVMLGGAWVPTFVFPQWLQTSTVIVPTRWAMDRLDAMTWRGLGLSPLSRRLR